MQRVKKTTFQEEKTEKKKCVYIYVCVYMYKQRGFKNVA